MTFRQFAYNNVIRNKRIYIGHFLSSTFAVMIFFIYGLLAFHPNMQGNLTEVSQTMNTFGRIGFQVSQYITYFFSIFFVLYSVSAFLKKRKIEFGILTIVGISPKQLKKLIFSENMIIGFASIVTGMGLGVILSKLILLISASILAIEKSLPYYFPIEAIVITGIAFIILFFLVSFFISKTVKTSELVDLIKSKEKPLPEPKLSIWLSLLAVVLISSGYGEVFYFAGSARHHLSSNELLLLLVSGVGLVVLGTYFLFTQLSGYVLKMMKKREALYFKKTNLLTFSELTYRMKENAKTFFLVSIISASAFVAIGVASSFGDVLMKEIGSPFAISYESYNENEYESDHISEIETQLTQANIDYIHVTVHHTWMEVENESSIQVMRLTDYNQIATKLGYQVEDLDNDRYSFIIQQSMENKNKTSISDSLQYKVGNNFETLHVKKTIENQHLQDYNKVIVITDSLYEKVIESHELRNEWTLHGFVIDDWKETLQVSKDIASTIDDNPSNSVNSTFYLTFLSVQWQEMKELNGILSILTVLVGIVFFVFACSFLYFRLFTDLDKDQQQYQMLSKIGLSLKELRKVVTRQMGLLFFLPMTVAIVHSIVAFIALQNLLESEFTSFSVLQSSIVVLASFISLQTIYFIVIRRNYLRQLVKSII